ncbi:hydrolase [Actibacterium mucosum KCTC 23349]|uniref:Hydrolase n=1 Tax=Actibacterium mucosum KCTC 23349 TaxID=1454373 RepID=A0A037ZHR0_9RHOB|nr:alpha/beta hydrolase [Actibacterium mucosum]KAJ55960.1 hydrolase [Actibacterium mucosum KCTC 23349]
MMPHFHADDGARIHFTDTGDGPVLLCLSGLSRNSDDFQYLRPHLPGIRMICMDYRGRGKSDWTGAETYTLQREGTDVVQLLAHLGLGSVPILGTSRGGLIGLGLALTVPDVVAGLCMNDIGPVIEPEGLERIRDYVGVNPGLPSFDTAAAHLEKGAYGFANVAPDRWVQEARTHFREESDGLRINYDPALRDAFLEAFVVPMPEAWPFFEALNGKPVGLIRGAGSDLMSRETALKMKGLRPDLNWADVPDRGHVPFLDEPEALQVINDFMAVV